MKNCKNYVLCCVMKYIDTQINVYNVNVSKKSRNSIVSYSEAYFNLAKTVVRQAYQYMAHNALSPKQQTSGSRLHYFEARLLWVENNCALVLIRQTYLWVENKCVLVLKRSTYLKKDLSKRHPSFTIKNASHLLRLWIPLYYRRMV